MTPLRSHSWWQISVGTLSQTAFLHFMPLYFLKLLLLYISVCMFPSPTSVLTFRCNFVGQVPNDSLSWSAPVIHVSATHKCTHQICGEGPQILIISYFTAAVNSCYSLITRLQELWTLFVVNFAQENWVFTTILAEMLIITIMIKWWGLETSAGMNLETQGCQLVWLCRKICRKKSGL